MLFYCFVSYALLLAIGLSMLDRLLASCWVVQVKQRAWAGNIAISLNSALHIEC